MLAIMPDSWPPLSDNFSNKLPFENISNIPMLVTTTSEKHSKTYIGVKYVLPETICDISRPVMDNVLKLNAIMPRYWERFRNKLPPLFIEYATAPPTTPDFWSSLRVVFAESLDYHNVIDSSREKDPPPAHHPQNLHAYDTPMASLIFSLTLVCGPSNSFLRCQKVVRLLQSYMIEGTTLGRRVPFIRDQRKIIATLGSLELPRLISSQNNDYPLVAIGGHHVIGAQSVQKLGRELARTLSIAMSVPDDLAVSGNESERDRGPVPNFYLFSVICNALDVHFCAHFAVRLESGLAYHAVDIASVSMTLNADRRDFALPYMLACVQDHTVRMAAKLEAHLGLFSDSELAKCHTEFLQPLPAFERTCHHIPLSEPVGAANTT